MLANLSLFSLSMGALVGCAGDDAETDKDIGTVPVDTDPGDTDTTDTDSPAPTETGVIDDTGLTPPITPTGDTGVVVVPLPLCSDLNLAITPTEPATVPFGLVTLSASGGTGAYRFEVQGGEGDIDPNSGIYLAPETADITETIVLSDAGCEGDVEVELEVLQALTLEPAVATVTPTTVFELTPLTGSGDVSCLLVANGSGGSLIGCSYYAGLLPGTDVVEMTDNRTGDTARSTITVDEDAGLVLPTHYFLPAGSTQSVDIQGGSGLYTMQVLTGSSVSVVGDKLEALSVGTSTVQVLDSILGFEQELSVHVADGLAPELKAYGTRAFLGVSRAAGDLNGDGFEDVVYGSSELAFDAYDGGAVLVYAGNASGLDPVPVFETTGDVYGDAMGRAIRLADVNQDGETDLIVTADAADFDSSNVGEIYVHLGVPGGFFEDEPAWILRSPAADRLGTSLSVCDLDGDGWQDIVAGAITAEDASAAVVTGSQGSIMVFPGAITGFEPEPTIVRYGLTTDGFGGLIGIVNMQMGLYGMDSGDYNGDGLCDVAVGSLRGAEFAVDSSVGTVTIYQGTNNGTYLESLPARLIHHSGGPDLADTNAAFGRRIVGGDVDQDGRTDWLINGIYHDGVGLTNAGGAFLFLAASDDGRPVEEVLTTDEADMVFEGELANTYVHGIDMADFDGDGDLDIFVGFPRGAAADGLISYPGSIVAFEGSDAAAGISTELARWEGDEAEGFFGQVLSVLPDVDGDGAVDLFTWAGRHDQGIGEVRDLGQPMLVHSDGTLDYLVQDSQPAGQDVGRALSWMDVDKDGLDDLIIGAPQAGNIEKGSFAGQVSWARAQASGDSMTP